MNELQLQAEALKDKMAEQKWIDVDEGWYQLIVDCDKELTAIDPNYAIFQIKEKFGALRYYMSPSNDTTPEQRDAMWAITEKYEALSRTVCEATGGPGVLMKSVGGWRKTLNPEYAESALHYAGYSIVEQSEIKLDDNRKV
jgi:hypothetical protein